MHAARSLRADYLAPRPAKKSHVRTYADLVARGYSPEAGIVLLKRAYGLTGDEARAVRAAAGI